MARARQLSIIGFSAMRYRRGSEDVKAGIQKCIADIPPSGNICRGLQTYHTSNDSEVYMFGIALCAVHEAKVRHDKRNEIV